MSIRSSEYFIFDGQQSSDFGIINININSGMQSEPFVADEEIQEVYIRGNDRPYYQGTTKKPLQFPVSFAFEDTWDTEKIRSVARWLTNHNYYKPLQFSYDLERVFYCKFVDSAELIHNCLSQGYITLTARCDSPYSYSQYYEQIVDCSSNTVGGTDFTFINQGDLECKPLLYVEVVSGASFSIINSSDGGETLSFTGLATNELLTIDNENEDIETNIALTYRYSNHNGVFLSLPYGYNYLKIFGNVKLKFKYQFTRLQ